MRAVVVDPDLYARMIEQEIRTRMGREIARMIEQDLKLPPKADFPIRSYNAFPIRSYNASGQFTLPVHIFTTSGSWHEPVTMGDPVGAPVAPPAPSRPVACSKCNEPNHYADAIDAAGNPYTCYGCRRGV